MERKERKELSSSNSQNMPTLKASYAIDDTAPAMTLKTIAENYSKWFPLVVRVREGCFESEEEEVPTDDVYVLHSVKPIKAILLQAGFYSNCDTKLIPVTADIEVGLMPKVTHFPPIHGQGTARILPTVNDVMALVPHLPMVLCATKNYDSGRPSSSVRASEVIVIKKVTRSVKSFGRRVLKVHSVLEGREKTLKHNCAGFFSTDPLKTRLKLSYLLAHAKVSFPARAHVFYAPGDATTLPPHFYHNPVTLMALVESQSILATSYVDSDELGKCPSRHFELPVYLPISVSLYRHEQKYTYNHGCEAQKPNVYIPRAIHRDDSNDNWNWDENSDTTVDWISLEHLADLEDQPFMPSATESRKGMPSDGSSFSGVRKF